VRPFPAARVRRPAGAATTNSKIQPTQKVSQTKEGATRAPSLFIVGSSFGSRVKTPRLQAALLEISGLNRRGVKSFLPSFSRSSFLAASNRPESTPDASVISLIADGQIASC
jgi:hypothetical protein